MHNKFISNFRLFHIPRCSKATSTRLGVLLITILLLSACGGGGGGNNKDYDAYNGNALKLPAKIELASANEIDTQSQTVKLTAFDSSGTDYSNDPVRTWHVRTDTFDLEDLNIYLCLLDHIAVNDKINQGPFKVDFALNTCKTPDGDNIDYNTDLIFPFTVDSYRVDNNSPHIIQLWLDEVTVEAEYGSNKFVGEFIITEEESSDHPYGRFRFSTLSYFKPAGKETFSISHLAYYEVKTGDNGLPRIESVSETPEDSDLSPDYLWNTKSITEITDANLSSGTGVFYEKFYIARTSDADSSVIYEKIESTTATAFNADFVSTAEQYDDDENRFSTNCQSRNETTNNIYRYQFYYAYDNDAQNIRAGQRLVLQPGQSIQFDYTHVTENDRDGIEIPEPGIPLSLTYYDYGSLTGLYAYSAEIGSRKYKLNDGVLLTSTQQPAVDYVVKATQFLIEPVDVDNAQCSTLDVESNFSNPSLDLSQLASPGLPSVDLEDKPRL